MGELVFCTAPTRGCRAPAGAYGPWDGIAAVLTGGRGAGHGAAAAAGARAWRREVRMNGGWSSSKKRPGLDSGHWPASANQPRARAMRQKSLPRKIDTYLKACIINNKGIAISRAPRSEKVSVARAFFCDQHGDKQTRNLRGCHIFYAKLTRKIIMKYR